MPSFFQVGDAQSVCLSACDDQINSVSVTSSDFPNRETFVRREEFCLTLTKLTKTCASEKKEFLVNKFPNVCVNIDQLMVRLDSLGMVLCENLRWDPVRLWNFSRNDTGIKLLEEDIFYYAKMNLAVVNVYIKDPVVTRIMRDQKIPIIAFVANTGGLLGLCMGFSLVSVFEVLYHLMGAIRKWWWLRFGSGSHRLVAASATVAAATAITAADLQLTEVTPGPQQQQEQEERQQQQQQQQSQGADAATEMLATNGRITTANVLLPPFGNCLTNQNDPMRSSRRRRSSCHSRSSGNLALENGESSELGLDISESAGAATLCDDDNLAATPGSGLTVPLLGSATAEAAMEAPVTSCDRGEGKSKTKMEKRLRREDEEDVVEAKVGDYPPPITSCPATAEPTVAASGASASSHADLADADAAKIEGIVKERLL